MAEERGSQEKKGARATKKNEGLGGTKKQRGNQGIKVGKEQIVVGAQRVIERKKPTGKGKKIELTNARTGGENGKVTLDASWLVG